MEEIILQEGIEIDFDLTTEKSKSSRYVLQPKNEQINIHLSNSNSNIKYTLGHAFGDQNSYSLDNCTTQINMNDCTSIFFELISTSADDNVKVTISC